MPSRGGRAGHIMVVALVLAVLAASCSGSETGSDGVDDPDDSAGSEADDAAGSGNDGTGDPDAGGEDPADGDNTGESTADGAGGVDGLPDTPVGDQVALVLNAALDGSLTEDLTVQWFSDDFRAQVPPSQLVSMSAQLSTLLGPDPRLDTIQIDATHVLAGTLVNPADDSRWDLAASIEVGDEHRLVGFTITSSPGLDPDPSVVDLVSAVAAWSALGADADLLVTEVPADTEPDGGEACPAERPALPIGSAFKLYVLGAVATAVESGAVDWSDEVTIDDAHRSLPSGQLQVEPAGTTLSVADAAQLMMAISDNTATDHLMALVGREQVEAEQAALGHGQPELNQPFPTTLELFQLKLGDPDRLDRYGQGSEAERRDVLDELAGEPLPALAAGAFTTPTALDVEWFASTGDLCRAMVGLAQRGLVDPTIGRALGANRGVPFDPGVWPTAWFKGGSEPGVLSLTWLVERADGTRFVVSGSVSDPTSPIDEPAAVRIMLAVFTFLADT